MQANPILFIQGGGEDGYNADKNLVFSLSQILGDQYRISYPELSSDDSLLDYGWPQQIGAAIHQIDETFILAGHSFGASMILRYLTENPGPKHLKGIILLATPFWGGDESWQAGLKLPDDFAGSLPQGLPFFFYHCIDDEEVPFSHFKLYLKKIRGATFRAIANGGHQFTSGLTLVAADIKSL